MDLTEYRSKLIGSEEERAVSPVIGVILMVAITVILAAVIAAFVLDLGQSQSANANAGVSFDGNDTYVEVQITDMGNADTVEISETNNNINTGGSSDCSSADPCELDSVGDTAIVDGSSTDVDVTVVAVSGDDENVINNYPDN